MKVNNVSNNNCTSALKLDIGKLSCCINLIFAIVVLCLSIFVFHDKSIATYISIVVTSLIPFIIIWLSKRLGWYLPNYILVLICVHIICSVDLGSVFHFYDKINWWDLAVHGLFGFIGCSFIYYLSCHFINQKINFFMFFSFFLMTVGLAGLWEIWEFIVSTITKEDVMRVQESIEAGHSPLFDTITDMLITMVGILIFDTTLFYRKYIKKQ